MILLNTCAVRDKATQKVFTALGRLRRLKRRNPRLLIGVTGCVAQLEGEAIFRRAPFVNLVLGPRGISALPALIEKARREPAIQLEPLEESLTPPFESTARTGGTKAVPRVADLASLTPSTMGKIEIESMDEGRDAEIIQHLLQSSVLVTFKDSLEHEDVRGILDAFEETEAVVHTGDDIADADYLTMVESMPALGSALTALGYAPDDLSDAALVASGVEFILEGLHLSKRLNKEALGASAVYRSR